VTAQRRIILQAAWENLRDGHVGVVRNACADLLARDGGDIEASLFLGLALGAAGQADEAAPLLDRVARVRRNFAHPCRDLAALLQQIGRPDLIVPQYRENLRHAPDDVALHYAFADHLHEAGQGAEALEVLEGAIAVDPGFAPAHNLAGIVRADLGDTTAAIAHFRRAIAILPDDAAGWANLGMQLKIEDRFDEALAAYDAALARSPADAHIRLNRALALLRAGRLAEAWPDYECRLWRAADAALPPERLLPSRSVLSDLAGRTVLVTHQDGFGDTLQFARYLPLLAARGARVLIWVPAELVALLCRMPGVAEVLSGSRPAPPHDFHCPFTSLPRAFETELRDIPAGVPYLRADPDRVAFWAARLPPRAPGALRVGLVWAGQARPHMPGFATLDAHRSMTLADFAPLGGMQGIQFISLQKGPAAAQAAAPPPGLVLHDPMDAVGDFADTAGIVANLDLLVSVDTSVAHLAGAMGGKVLLLDRFDNCWRWLAGREDSPWYPTLRIIRQQRPGDWAGVMRRVVLAVQAKAEAAGD
jgi:tetratricopeptide (TPR) repeat protein